MSKRKYFTISYPDLEIIVLESIIYFKANSFSSSWLYNKFKEKTILESEVQKE